MFSRYQNKYIQGGGYAGSQSPIFLSVSCLFWVSGWLLAGNHCGRQGRQGDTKTGDRKTHLYNQEGKVKLTEGPTYRPNFGTNVLEKLTNDRTYFSVKFNNQPGSILLEPGVAGRYPLPIEHCSAVLCMNRKPNLALVPPAVTASSLLL